MYVTFGWFLARIALCVGCISGLFISDTAAVVPDGGYVNISLENYNTSSVAGHLIKDMKQILPFSTIILNVIRIPETIRFIIVQAHTFQYNVTLSYNAVLAPHSFINGTNLGLVQLINKNQNNAKFYIQNRNARPNISVLMTVQGYAEGAPVPGGCNKEFSVQTAPYLITTFTESLIFVDSQPASAAVPHGEPHPPCESQQMQYEMYHMFLPERDLSSHTYFSALLKMSTVQDIRLNGRKVPGPTKGSLTRRIYSAYSGTGSVYAVVAKSGTLASAYVPAVSYACSTVYRTDGCVVLSTAFSRVLCAVIFFLGLFLCLCGHQFFKTETFLFGFLSGGLIFYMTIALFSTLSASVNAVLSVLLGLCSGIFWLGLWWCCGIPVLSVLLATLTLGFVVAGTATYGWLGDVQILRNNVNFWLLFSCIAVSVSLLFLSLVQKANIISCAVLGAYSVIIPVDHYIGSNLKYIVVNVIRRATVKDFSLAIVDPPFQMRDAVLCSVWVALAAVGAAVQCYKQRGRAPFPPPPNTRHREYFRRRRFPCASQASRERAPLLIGADIPPARIPCITTSCANDDVFESPRHSSRVFRLFKR